MTLLLSFVTILQSCYWGSNTTRKHAQATDAMIFFYGQNRHAIIILWFRHAHHHPVQHATTKKCDVYFETSLVFTLSLMSHIAHSVVACGPELRNFIHPKRRFSKDEQRRNADFEWSTFSRAWVLDLGYDSLKSASKIRISSFVHPSQIFVWGPKI